MATGDSTPASLEVFPIGQRGIPITVARSPDIDKKFLCGWCKLLLRSPRQSTCGHRFCTPCIDQLLSNQARVTCPACESDGHVDDDSNLVRDSIYPDNAIKRDFTLVKAKCINDSCGWTGNLKEYPEHEVSCEFRHSQCECGRMIALITMNEHKRKDCPKREWICLNCRYRGTAEQEEIHMKDCPEQPTNCIHCNKPNILRSQIRVHQTNECPKASELITCPFNCVQMVKQSNFENHMSNSMPDHMMTLLRRVTTLAGSSGQDQLMNTLSREPDQTAGTSRPQQQDGNAETLHRTMTQISEKQTMLENVATVLQDEMLKIVRRLDDVERMRVSNSGDTPRHIQSMLADKDKKIQELSDRMSQMEMISHDGTLLWRISNVTQFRQDAQQGRTPSQYSPPFFTGVSGYKMCARLYFNGDGMGRGTHLSLYFVVMKGPCDALLKWPFSQKVTMMLIDQKDRARNISDAFRPDATSSSFQKPQTEMNIASGCPLFCPLTTLDQKDRGYVVNDTMFIRIVVETSDIKLQY